MPHQATLVERIVAFSRRLRAAGVRLNTTSVRTALQALSAVAVTDRESFYHALLASLTAAPEERAIFDAVFADYWGLTLEDQPGFGDARTMAGARARPGAPSDAEPAPGDELTGMDGASGEGDGGDGEDGGTGDAPDRRDVGSAGESDAASSDQSGSAADGGSELVAGGQRGGASLTEIPGVRLFQLATPTELARLRQVVTRLLSRLQYLPTSRGARRRPGPTLDQRRTLRAAMRQGGEVLDLRFRRKSPGRIDVAVMLDISGSMDSHTEFLLQFLYALQGSARNVETFVFSTRLSRITPYLRRGYGAARAEVARRVRHWSGGTRQGDCLREFNDRWAQACSGASTSVLIIGDGWDRGDPAVLASELARLRGHVRRLIWLNPLLGVPGYQPLARGLRVATAYVDDFLPARDTASMLRAVSLMAAR